MKEKGMLRVSNREFVKFTVLALLSGFGRAQIPAASQHLIQERRPMYEARRELQPLYGKVITYEEPVLSWKDELESQASGVRMIPKVRSFVMPGAALSAASAEAALGKTLDAYHEQLPGTHFRLLTSKLGYHIVPDQACNEHGDVVSTNSLLDAEVSVPVEERTPEEHLDALGAAVTAATGIRLRPAPIPLSPGGFDRSFQLKSSRFPWGIRSMVARDGLIDLLYRGASTYSWDLMCSTSTIASDRVCILTVTFLKVAITEPSGKPGTKVLMFDRCGVRLPPELRQTVKA
jgi:hypothetical protein